MKAILILITSCLPAIISMAQKIDSSAMSKLAPEVQQQVNGHLQKSKKAKTIAYSLLAGGIVFETIGITIAVKDANNDTGGNAEAVAALFGFTGAAAIVGSIPFFIKGHRQKEMARILVFGDKPVSISPNVTIPKSSSFGIKFIMPVGR